MTDIYSSITITKSILENFKPTRLYIKESNGLKYFGKSVKDDIIEYTGSGKFWVRHIKKYGKNTIRTIWVSEWFLNPHEIQEYAIKFSKDNDIVKSKEWANLKAENGLSGGLVINNHFATSDFNKSPRTSEHKKAIGDGQRGRKESDVVKSNKSAANRTPENIKKFREMSLGSKFWNNGVVTIRSKSFPGDEWVPGIIKVCKGKKIKIDNISFESFTAARKYFNVSQSRILIWLKSGRANLIL